MVLFTLILNYSFLWLARKLFREESHTHTHQCNWSLRHLHHASGASSSPGRGWDWTLLCRDRAGVRTLPLLCKRRARIQKLQRLSIECRSNYVCLHVVRLRFAWSSHCLREVSSWSDFAWAALDLTLHFGFFLPFGSVCLNCKHFREVMLVLFTLDLRMVWQIPICLLGANGIRAAHWTLLHHYCASEALSKIVTKLLARLQWVAVLRTVATTKRRWTMLLGAVNK